MPSIVTRKENKMTRVSRLIIGWVFIIWAIVLILSMVSELFLIDWAVHNNSIGLMNLFMNIGHISLSVSWIGDWIWWILPSIIMVVSMFVGIMVAYYRNKKGIE